MTRSLPFKILLCAITTLLLGGLGGWLTGGSNPNWYATLKHPPGKPSNWLFGPVWTVLYLMIGTSAALIWHHHPKQVGRTRSTFCFSLQLILNFCWTPAFFGAHQIELALVIIILMWLAIFMTIREFGHFSKPAAFLLVPYLLWVSYATYLNASYACLN